MCSLALGFLAAALRPQLLLQNGWVFSAALHGSSQPVGLARLVQP